MESIHQSAVCFQDAAALQHSWTESERSLMSCCVSVRRGWIHWFSNLVKPVCETIFSFIPQNWLFMISGSLTSLVFSITRWIKGSDSLQTCRPAWQQAQISGTVGSRTLLFHQRISLHTWGTISARQTRRACLLSIRMFLMRSGGWQRSDESGDQERQRSTSVESAGPPSGIECQHGTRWDPDTIHRIIMRFLLRDRRPKIKPEAREHYLTGVHLHNSLCNVNIADKYHKKRRNVF